MASASAHPHQNRLLGILFRLGAVACFGVMAAMIKLSFEHGVSLVETVFYRFALGLPPVFGWIAVTRSFGAWRTQRPLAHLSRIGIGLVSMVLTFSALDWLPLAEATTINFAAPLFSVILSALILKETVGRHRWSAVAIGFAGVILVMRPDSAHLPAEGLATAIGGAIGVACVTITIRQIGRTEGPVTTVLWFTGLSTLLVGTLMPLFAQAHDGRTWLILVALGTSGGIAQLLMTASLRYASVATVTPFDYLQLLCAVLAGWLIWDMQPGTTTWAGAAIIIGSGLYTLYREHKLGVEKEIEPAL